ncbi:hypothetical protein D9M68_736790 [compost metagenome]
MHFAAVAPPQRHQHGPRRPTGADDHGVHGAIGPTGRAGVEIAEKSQIIGIGAVHLAVANHQRVDRANGAGEGIDAVAERKHRFLMGNGDIAAGKFAGPQPLEKSRQVRRRYVDRFVTAINAVLLQPGAVNERGARMVDRVADNKGFGGHDRVSGAWRRSAASRDSSGRPRMVK